MKTARAAALLCYCAAVAEAFVSGKALQNWQKTNPRSVDDPNSPLNVLLHTNWETHKTPSFECIIKVNRTWASTGTDVTATATPAGINVKQASPCAYSLTCRRRCALNAWCTAWLWTKHNSSTAPVCSLTADNTAGISWVDHVVAESRGHPEFGESQCAKNGEICHCDGMVKYGNSLHWTIYHTCKTQVRCIEKTFEDEFLVFDSSPRSDKVCRCKEIRAVVWSPLPLMRGGWRCSNSTGPASTQSPTLTPTLTPTSAPVRGPPNPTSMPTESNMPTSSVSPTLTPTLTPTSAPVPTSMPTESNMPTSSVSVPPTSRPTVSPTELMEEVVAEGLFNKYKVVWIAGGSGLCLFCVCLNGGICMVIRKLTRESKERDSLIRDVAMINSQRGPSGLSTAETVDNPMSRKSNAYADGMDASRRASTGGDYTMELKRRPSILSTSQRWDLLRDTTLREDILRDAAGETPFDEIVSNENASELQVYEEIGRGSSGTVYAGSFRGVPVAVKGFSFNNISRDQFEELLAGFKAEVVMCCKLNHPNVVQFYGYTTQPEVRLIQELALSSLYAMLHSDLALSNPDKHFIARQVAQGMNYLHHGLPHPIVHRDLKTLNVLLFEGMRVKITDFGLARQKAIAFSTGETYKMTQIGTPYWTAPEVFRDEVYNETADVYSFAICLWEVWERKTPWEGLPPVQVAVKVVTEMARPKLSEGIDPDIHRLITQCWEDDPSQRPRFDAIVALLEDSYMSRKSLRASAMADFKDSDFQDSDDRAKSSAGADNGMTLEDLVAVPERRSSQLRHSSLTSNSAISPRGLSRSRAASASFTVPRSRGDSIYDQSDEL